MGKALTAVIVAVMLAGCGGERRFEGYTLDGDRPYFLYVLDKDTGAVKSCIFRRADSGLHTICSDEAIGSEVATDPEIQRLVEKYAPSQTEDCVVEEVREVNGATVRFCAD